MAQKIGRRWYQFSLRTVFGVTALVCCICYFTPAAIDYLNGWPKHVSSIMLNNRTGKPIIRMQVLNSDGSILIDSNPNFSKRGVPHFAGTGWDWKPEERPRVGRRVSVKWIDVENRHHRVSICISGLDPNGMLDVTILPNDVVSCEVQSGKEGSR